MAILGGIALWRLIPRHSDARRAPLPLTSWAVPETEAEAALLRTAVEDRGRERLAGYYLGAGRPFDALWQLQEALPGSNGTHGSTTRDRALPSARALTSGKWFASAARLLEPIAVASAQNGRTARALLADVYLATGRPEQASRILARDGTRAVVAPISAEGQEERTEGVVALARASWAAGDASLARHLLERARLQAPDRPEPCYWLGLLLLEQGEPSPAVGYLQRAVQLDPRSVRFQVALGRALMGRGAAGDLAEAGRILTAARDLAPNDPSPLLQFGILLQGQHRRREAGHAFLGVLRLDPRSVEAHRRLGALMEALGEPARAHHHRGWAAVFADQPQEAVREFQAVAAQDPGNVEATLLVAQGYTGMVQETRAAALVERAWKRYPNDPRVIGRLAGLYLITHDWPAAAARCEDWLRLQPNAAEPFWVKGKLAIAEGRLDEGIRLLTKATARAPSAAEYFYDLGEALARRPAAENLRRAAAALGRAVSLEPEKPRYRYLLGVALLRLDELEGARRQLLRVLDQDPRRVEAVTGLVQVAQAMERPQLARVWAGVVPTLEANSREEADLRRRLGQQPDDPQSRLALALLLIRHGDLTTARHHLAYLLQRRPDAAAAHRTLKTIERCLTVIGG